MNTMHQFKQYLICFILLFIFVGYMSKAFIASTYIPIRNIEITSESPKIEIMEAKSTNVNGFVVAKITNNTSSVIDNKYIKLDFFSKHDNILGSKYLKVSNLDIDDTAQFKLDYKFDGVKSIKGNVVDALPDGENINISLELTREEKLALTIGALIVTYYMPVGFLFDLFP